MLRWLMPALLLEASALWGEGFNIDREPEVGMPRLPWSDIRVVRLKLTHTFVPW